MIYIILLWFGYYTSQKSELRKENLFLLIYMAIPFLVFSVAKTKMQGYLLFTFPAYFIIIGLFIETLLFRKTITPRQSTLYKVNVLIVVAIFSLAVRYSLERVKPFKTYHQESLAKKELQGITFPAKAVLFNIHCPIELMFYTDCIAYPSIPDNDLINKLRHKNYNLFIVDNGNLSNEIMNDSRIAKLKLHTTMQICQ